MFLTASYYFTKLEVVTAQISRWAVLGMARELLFIKPESAEAAPNLKMLADK